MEDPYTYSNASAILRVLLKVFHFGVLCMLATFGIAATWTRNSRRISWLVLMLFAYASSVAVFYVFGRYRFPLVPFLILFAAAGLATTIALARRKEFRRLAMSGGLAVMAGVIVDRDLVTESSVRAVTEFNFGAALVDQPGRTMEAVKHYAAALELDPFMAESYNGLATVYARQGNAEQAAACYRHALELKPFLPEARYNLGNLLLQQGKVPEAIEQFTQAVRLRPANALAHAGLGIAFEQLGRTNEAVEELEKAVRLQPDLFEAHGNLGLLYWRVGRKRDALTHFEEAVHLRPGSVEARRNLDDVIHQFGPASEISQ